MLFKHCCSLSQTFQVTLYSKSSQWSRGFDCSKIAACHSHQCIEIFSNSFSADKKSFSFIYHHTLVLLLSSDIWSFILHQIHIVLFKEFYLLTSSVIFLFSHPHTCYHLRSWQMPSLVLSSTSSANWQTASRLRTLGEKYWRALSWQQVILFFFFSRPSSEKIYFCKCLFRATAPNIKGIWYCDAAAQHLHRVKWLKRCLLCMFCSVSQLCISQQGPDSAPFFYSWAVIVLHLCIFM